MAKKNNSYKKNIISEHQKKIESYKKKLWESRVAFVKKGSVLVQGRMFGEAAIVYEKYLKILELIYDCKQNELKPEMFKNSSRLAELSVITAVYWDLVRIYDSNKAYLPRQKKAAEQLIQFSNYTPLYAQIVKKAELFQKVSKNPEVIRHLISVSTKKSARCFIATSAFESADAFEVKALRIYRDENLLNSNLGQRFIFIYYKYSPAIACFMDKHTYLKAPIRLVLRILIKCVT